MRGHVLRRFGTATLPAHSLSLASPAPKVNHRSPKCSTLFSLKLGEATALAGTIRFAIGQDSRPNLFKMTLPGHGFVQKFLAEARSKHCTYAVIEITSEAAVQYRHLDLELDALVFTNLQKEHLESHGSMEHYFRAKFSIGKALVHSKKRPRSIIAYADDVRAKAFLSLPVENQISFSLADITDLHLDTTYVSFSYRNIPFILSFPGEFMVLNALAAIKTAEMCGVPLETCAKALRELSHISGRVERIEAGQNFIAIVDYAHTPDSLRALYNAFPNQRKICVLGNTGGGRDTWKRPEMGRIAEEACNKIILTNEDPYDEDPHDIVNAMRAGMQRTPDIIMDRREAIRVALASAQPGDVVFVTGKGTDPFIMGPRGTKIVWNDAEVVREELERLLAKL